MSNDTSCDNKGNKKNVLQMLKSSPYLQRSLVQDSGHLLAPMFNDIGCDKEDIEEECLAHA